MKTDNNDKVESLNLFITKINELRNSSYVTFVLQNKTSVSLNYNVDKGLTIISHHADEDAIKSLILTLRMFIQDKDRISIRKTATFMRDLGFDKELIISFERGRQNINDFLDSIADIYNNEPLTYRKTIDVFFYGCFAHVDQKQYEIFKLWKNDEYFFEFRKNSLLGAMNSIVGFLLFYENSIKQELDRIASL